MSDAPQPTLYNCPFYGRHGTILQTNSHAERPYEFILLEQRWDECGLISGAPLRCILSNQGLPVEWRSCPELVRIVVDLRRR
jgi:hypothetical protein